MTDTSSDTQEAGMSHEGSAEPDLCFAQPSKSTLQQYLEENKLTRWAASRLRGDESRW